MKAQFLLNIVKIKKYIVTFILRLIPYNILVFTIYSLKLVNFQEQYFNIVIQTNLE